MLSVRSNCNRRASAPRVFELLEARTVFSTSYLAHDLISDQPGVAPVTDPNLVNAWGIAVGPVTMWVSSNEKNLSNVYTGDVSGSPFVKNPLEVNIPGGAPTGQVFNSTTSDFLVTDGTHTAKALFIFASESGAVTGWAPSLPPPPPSHDAQAGFQATDDAIYKGIALAANKGANLLYVTDFHNAKIDVLDSQFHLTHVAGSFADPNLPEGFAPFNIAAVNGKLYVTYAQQDEDAEDDVTGAGKGFIDVFTTDGVFVQRLVSQGKLNAPWGMALAPSNFGDFSNDLLVGNFGDGKINAYDPTSGAFRGTLSQSPGHALATEGLWGLAFGNGTTAGDTSTLYFAAGPDGEAHGLIGKITANAAGTSPVSATLHDGVLTVLGSRGNDRITVSQSFKGIQVMGDGQRIGSFDANVVTAIEVFGGQGNDVVSIAPNVHITALVDGGMGLDRLFGGGGPTVLLGGPGNDFLIGGAGRNVLIGGTGRDLIFGRNGGNILVSGSTAHDTDPAALIQILDEWSSNDSLITRKEKLSAGADGLPILDDSTVVNDDVRDMVFALNGENWIFRGGEDLLV